VTSAVDPATQEAFNALPGPQWDEDEGENVAVAPDGLRLTDTGNAQRFVDSARGQVRYVHKWGRWIVYDHGRWNVDANDALVTEMAKNVPRILMAMVPGINGKDERGRVFNAAVRAESSGALAAMVRLARGIPGVIVDHEDLNSDGLILNCTNGTVDLTTGELRPHDPADLCTQQCPVDYDPAAAAPLWDACMERWQPDPEVREYLQREAGAGATGRHTETLSIHYGLGANGKSKYFGAQQSALGDYSVVPHKSVIVASRHEQHATVVADLFRRRLVVAGETSDSARINEDQAKNLTGGDRITARRMREDPWEFDPTHTLIMFSNHLPNIAGTDNGIWRRVRLIPWDVTIPAAEQDEALGDKLDAELPGVLRWMVEGAVRYLKDGLGAPDRIVARTAEFRGDQDTVGRFIADVGIRTDPMGRVPTSVLTEAHEAWCADNGVGSKEVPGHWKRITAELRKLGANPRKRSNVRQWDGITVSDITPGQMANTTALGTGSTALPVTSMRVVNPQITGTPVLPVPNSSKSNGTGPPELTDADIDSLFYDEEMT
jgi:putative DNA primase/helicase